MLNNKLGVKLKQGLSLNITEDNYTPPKATHTRDISQLKGEPVSENMKDKESMSPTQPAENNWLLPNKTYSIQEFRQFNWANRGSSKQLNRLSTYESPLNKQRSLGLGATGKNLAIHNKKSDKDFCDNEEDLSIDGIAEFEYEQELADKLGALQQNIPRVLFMERLQSRGLES